jgi:hypothetical protein
MRARHAVQFRTIGLQMTFGIATHEGNAVQFAEVAAKLSRTLDRPPRPGRRDARQDAAGAATPPPMSRVRSPGRDLPGSPI